MWWFYFSCGQYQIWQICCIVLFISLQEDETDAMPCDNISNCETTEMYEIPIHNGEKSGIK